MKSLRLQQIEQLVIEKQNLSMSDLCAKLNISMNTLRSDVAQLVKMGRVEKIYGGVKSKSKNDLVPFKIREEERRDEKIKIAKKAAEFVKSGDVIFIDSGTTTFEIIRFLEDKRNITVITNNLACIDLALSYSNIDVIVLPGKLERDTFSFVSPDTVGRLEKYNINKCFMASTGVTIDGAVTNSSPLECEIKRMVMKKAQSKFLLVNGSKYPKAALMTYANLSDFDVVISDGGAQNAFAAQCSELGIKCHLV